MYVRRRGGDEGGGGELALTFGGGGGCETELGTGGEDNLLLIFQILDFFLESGKFLGTVRIAKCFVPRRYSSIDFLSENIDLVAQPVERRLRRH